MKTSAMRIVSLLLVLVMSISAVSITVFAEYVSDFSTPPLYLEQTADEDVGTVTVYVKASNAFTYVGGKITMKYDKAAFVLTSAKITGAEGLNLTKNLNSSEGVTLTLTTDEDVEFSQNDNFLTFVFTKEDNIADGNYSFVLDVEEWTNSSFGVDTFTDSMTNAVTYSAGGTSNPAEYTAGITAAATNANPVRVGQLLKVNVGANKDFASTEMTINYPAGLVTFDKDNSTLGNATVTDNGSGELKLADYGAVKTAAADNYVLAFTAIEQGDASFAIAKAGFGTGETAETADLENVEALPEALIIAIDATQYTVTMTDIFTGATGVNKGETYVFYPESATGAYYVYEQVQVLMGGDNVTPAKTDDGGWKIENVSGDLEISGTRTPKQYGVYWSGTDYTDVTNRPDYATYNQDFSFIMPANQEAGTADGYRYELTVTMGGKTYTGYTIDGQTYTIPGSDITDEIYIKIDKIVIPADQFEVKIGGTYASAVTADAYTVSAGSSVTLTLTPDAGYVYEIKVNDQKVEFVNNQYTISNVQANVTVEVVSKTLNLDIIESSDYLTVDGNNVYLVLVKIQKIDGYTYTYNDDYMYWSDKYDAYAIVVFGQPVITAESVALEKVDVIPTVVYDGDVNGTTNVDANDAQLVYNIYNAQYEGFTDAVTMEKFLEADMNGDKKINSEDAVYIINQILGITNN